MSSTTHRVATGSTQSAANRFSTVANNCADRSAPRMVPSAVPVSSRSSAVPPTMQNQAKHIMAGSNIAPTTYSRIVRPCDTRARNSPTKGVKAIHHAQ